MIDSETKAAYMGIKAPDSLRERVLDSVKEKEENRQHRFRLASSIKVLAACAAVILCISGGMIGYFSTLSTGVYVNETAVNENPVCVSKERNISLMDSSSEISLDIPLEIRNGSNAQISVSKGKLVVTGEDNSENVVENGETLEKTSVLRWKIDSASMDDIMTMEIQSKKDLMVYKLFYDKDQNIWIIEKTKD